MNYNSCEQVKTYSDFIEIYDELSKALLNLNSDKFEISENSSAMLEKFIQENSVDKETAIRSIIDYLKKLKSVDVKISFEPSMEFLEKIYLLIYQHINTHFLVKYEIDPAQFLGATISYNGKIYKHSLIQNG